MTKQAVGPEGSFVVGVYGTYVSTYVSTCVDVCVGVCDHRARPACNGSSCGGGIRPINAVRGRPPGPSGHRSVQCDTWRHAGPRGYYVQPTAWLPARRGSVAAGATRGIVPTGSIGPHAVLTSAEVSRFSGSITDHQCNQAVPRCAFSTWQIRCCCTRSN